jgi:hypothetical protein
MTPQASRKSRLRASSSGCGSRQTKAKRCTASVPSPLPGKLQTGPAGGGEGAKPPVSAEKGRADAKHQAVSRETGGPAPRPRPAGRGWGGRGQVETERAAITGVWRSSKRLCEASHNRSVACQTLMTLSRYKANISRLVFTAIYESFYLLESQ